MLHWSPDVVRQWDRWGWNVPKMIPSRRLQQVSPSVHLSSSSYTIHNLKMTFYDPLIYFPHPTSGASAALCVFLSCLSYIYTLSTVLQLQQQQQFHSFQRVFPNSLNAMPCKIMPRPRSRPRVRPSLHPRQGMGLCILPHFTCHLPFVLPRLIEIYVVYYDVDEECE
ncbi:hypothetical protein BD289DRAFT_59662 [Coniella lustricola]|uniref:Uncharacterized protein n=1 Tax=Coniella lustricola TaxID=2025994 RepID=A0A2T3A0P8_9PEZI|nr:hypothetical protein BD289DRAFT_59662 [Coniella lustricola]